MPATEPGMPSSAPRLLAPSQAQVQIQVSPEIDQLRYAVSAMEQQLAQRPDTQVLASELKLLSNQLALVTDLAIAEELVDDGLNQLRDKILAAPNSEQLIEVMYKLREDRYQQLQSFRLFNRQETLHWGWLG